MLEKISVQGCVFGANGPQTQRSPLPPHSFLQMLRVRLNSKVCRSGRAFVTQVNSGIQSDSAFKVDNQGIDVQLGNLRDLSQ